MMDKVSIKAVAPKAANQAVQTKPEVERPKVEVGVTQVTERWLVIAPDGTILGTASSKKEQFEMVQEWRENR